MAGAGSGAGMFRIFGSSAPSGRWPVTLTVSDLSVRKRSNLHFYRTDALLDRRRLAAHGMDDENDGEMAAQRHCCDGPRC